MAINTHNELSCNNSKFENLEGNCKTFFFFFCRELDIFKFSFYYKNFHLSFLMTSSPPQKKIPKATTDNNNLKKPPPQYV